MENEKLQERIAQLEFQNDQLIAELEYVDQLLRSVGFAEGLKSVKSAAQELSEYEHNQNRLYEDGMPDSPPGLDE
jgi:hypothetical protein